ncbi:hypothetical protein IOD16_39575 [Saccharothrix sp. 6-C]|uniref:hypothetical protein n=1 Tax=Saccharothrix sp. 6-C TaxID=2781735 RepID=UPI0019177369|nr:hypothetical protein [Saccharothrix sp. 6-C]QQQ76975.1 hypothetical protein IOD16_39575 [Saccharothrix sp. 6-C]
MDVDMWDGLAATELVEVKRRAAIVAEIAEVTPVVVDGAERFAWHDSGGQSAVWYFTPEGRALLLTFDHESELNLHGRGGYAVQESLYRGVPEELVRLVRDRPENYESLNLVDEVTGAAIHHAGGVFWFDGGQWREAEGLLAHCAREGLEPMVESGFGYCTEAYLFGLEFTPETVVGSRAEWYDDEAERAAALREIGEVFARHG